MRILIFHGYLLGGTGSNVYNARLAGALVALGHEVHLLCQDRHPEEQPFVDAIGDWDAGALQVRELRDESAGISSGAGRCTVYRPNIGNLLPVYVADRYEGIEARPFADCTDAEIAAYLDGNVPAVEEIVAHVRPDVALANHLVMGPAILARALAGRTPYAVKVHGSALEYTVKPHRERFLDFAREGLAGARGVLVGSHHTAASLWAALEDSALPARTRLGPPGVEVARFVPRDPPRAAAGLAELTARMRATAPESTGPESSGPGNAASAFARDELAAADALARLEPGRDRLVAFVGKLIVNKGVDLLLAAWPLVLQGTPNARLVVVGFGADRALFERLLGTLTAGDLEAAEGLALPHLRAFLRSLDGDARASYTDAARALPNRVVFTGRLDHGELSDLLPVCEAMVVPSTFPEAFGMVAAEAAACGVLPISAAHSGLAEVSSALSRAVPEEVAPLLSFPVDDASVAALAARIMAWLEIDPAVRERARAGLVQTVRERWSWEGVARGVIAAARGELDALAEP
ncbi:MAG TPA: glycosyltransferase family 4 protein [Solirubrobacteraceae bacterium]|jgi:glycosyltransferase involved in cell wall biosynthesis